MSKNPKIKIPPIEEIAKKKKIEDEESKNDDNQDEDENIEDMNNENPVNQNDEENTTEEENIPSPRFEIPPIPLNGGRTSEVEEDDEEEQKNRRGRPKTIPAKKACAKSMLVILNKLKRIQNVTLQDEVYMLAEDAILELKHLHDIIDEVL